MTLCIVWRDGSNIKFVSDSRLSFGSSGTSDFGIKVVRIPFHIYGPNESSGAKPLISSGDLERYPSMPIQYRIQYHARDSHIMKSVRRV